MIRIGIVLILLASHLQVYKWGVEQGKKSVNPSVSTQIVQKLLTKF
jgi:hypothetical protein